MPEKFQRPRILSASEENYIRGKCLVAAATPAELMQLIGHFDLLIDKYHGALQTLHGAMPDKIYVYGAHGDQWSTEEPPTDEDEFEVVDFTELLEES